jgi:hypothetical protein
MRTNENGSNKVTLSFVSFFFSFFCAKSHICRLISILEHFRASLDGTKACLVMLFIISAYSSVCNLSYVVNFRP